jgi:hypothetical protein
MNKETSKINILVIGTVEWYKDFAAILSNLTTNFTIEFICDIQKARARLWHNSYDILIIEEKFTKKHTIKLSKMAYAMSRPSIVICNNIIKNISYNCWKYMSKFTNTCETSKKLIHFMFPNKNVIRYVDNLANHHQYFDIITKEISDNIFNKMALSIANN